MNHTFALLFVFGAIAFIHFRAHERAQHLAAATPLIASLAHPVTLDTFRDLAIHAMVYSANAPIHWIH